VITLQERVHSSPPPAGWSMNKLHRVLRVRKGFKNTGMQEDNLLSLSYGRIVRKSIDAAEGLLPESFETYQIVEPGNIVMRLTDLQNDKRSLRQGLVKERGIVTSAYDALELEKGHDPRFWAYALLALDLAKYYYSLGGGVRQSIKFSDFPNDWIATPHADTQKAIADFLDRETTRIDQLIEKKQRLVEVLKERLRSELERLTTGTEPLHSELVPFRWVCRITEGQVDPTASEWANRPLIAPNHIEARTGRLIAIETAEEQGAISGKYAFPAGTVVYSKIRPNLAKACVSPVSGMCSADMYPILPDKSLLPRFLLMQLLSEKFTDWATLESMRVAMPKINRETLGSYRFWVPKIEVQQEAIESFSTTQDGVERLTDKVDASIARMREFRSALITAAVTGQIDVTTWGKQGQTDRRLEQIEEEMSGKEAVA